MRLGDRYRGIRRTSINYHNFIHHVFDIREDVSQPSFFVLHDHDHAEGWFLNYHEQLLAFYFSFLRLFINFE